MYRKPRVYIYTSSRCGAIDTEPQSLRARGHRGVSCAKVTTSRARHTYMYIYMCIYTARTREGISFHVLRSSNPLSASTAFFSHMRRPVFYVYIDTSSASLPLLGRCSVCAKVSPSLSLSCAGNRNVFTERAKSGKFRQSTNCREIAQLREEFKAHLTKPNMRARCIEGFSTLSV